ncbi:MAG: hypothetical protein R6U02_00695 [Alkalibacterium sp.]|uniref:hypothetical protein n=1 Tax=Alkalibacterium sp. TaxID=1872447 RepID=UPI003970909D
MPELFSIVVLIFVVLVWKDKQYKQLKKIIEEKELESSELLDYINSMENRLIFLYVGIFIMFMGLR